ncbi:MAG: hypothetical protein ACI4QM_02495 [Alphaproteobacteria bacterium]
MTKQFLFVFISSAALICATPGLCQTAANAGGTSAGSSASSTAVGRGLTQVQQTVSGAVGEVHQAVSGYAGTASQAVGEASKAAGSVGQITNLSNVSVGSVSNIGGAVQSVGSAVQGVNALTTQVGSWTGTNTGSGVLGSAFGQVSQVGQAIGATSSSIGNIMSVGNISIGSVSDLNSAVSTINSAASGVGNLSSQMDKYLGTDLGGSLGSLTGKDSALGSLTGSVGEVGDLIGQASGALDLIKNPQNLVQMGLGLVSFENISKLAMNAAEDAVLDLLSSPGVGIPISASAVQAKKATEEAAKKQSAAKDNDIAEEKEKQMDALGTRPKTPTDSVPQTQNAETNPSVDNCPAYMAQFPNATNLAYDFLKANVLDNKTVSQYGPAQANVDAAVSYIKSTYYIQDTDKQTAENKEAVQQKRRLYLSEVSSQILSYGIGVQQNLVEDAKSISVAPTSGCDYIDDINTNTLIMIALAKQTMADIILQIGVAELEAVYQNVHMPVEILAKPEIKAK